MYIRFFKSYCVLSFFAIVGISFFDVFLSDNSLFGVGGVKDLNIFAPFDVSTPLHHFGLPAIFSFYFHPNLYLLINSLTIFLFTSWALERRLGFKTLMFIQLFTQTGTLVLLTAFHELQIISIAPISGAWLAGVGYGALTLYLKPNKTQFLALLVLAPLVVHFFLGANFSLPVLLSICCSTLAGQLTTYLIPLRRKTF